MRLIAAPFLGLALLLSAPGLPAAPAAPVLADAPEFSQEQAFLLPAPVERPPLFFATVAGSLVVEPDGSVSDVKLKLPGDAGRIFREALAKQRFQPVEIDGQIVRAHAFFELRARAAPIDGSSEARLFIDDLTFVDPPAAGLRHAPRHTTSLTPPRYPSSAAQRGVGALVLVRVQLNAEGRVVRAGIQDMSLYALEARSSARAERAARLFVDRTLDAVRDWTFDMDAIGGIDASNPVVLVPVSFTPPTMSRDGWMPTIPLNVRLLPWMRDSDIAVALTGSGTAPSEKFKLLEDPRGAQVN